MANETAQIASAHATAIRIVHGDHDRATSHLGTLKLFERLRPKDKQIKIYEGYEHGERNLSWL